MSLDKDDVRWLMRGRQRAAVVRVLRKPMTASEICRAAHPINPHIQLRDLWFLMDELKKRRLVVCLNPRHTTGKLYALTDRGRETALCAFGLRFPPIPNGVNWRKYAQVARARARKLVLLELACLPLSAAQPQPNAQLVTTALVAGIPLSRAALTVPTSSPTGEMRLRSMAGHLEHKSLERCANPRFLRRLSNEILELNGHGDTHSQAAS